MDNRTYETSHPWLTFQLDAKRFDPRVWMLLGEATSKFEHLAGSPLRPDVAQKLHRVYLAKGAHATTAIEGNTLTEEQVQKLLDHELELPPSKSYLAREVQNVVDACNSIWADILGGNLDELSVDLIKQFNRTLLDGLDVGGQVVPGEIRTYSVGVLQYRGAPARDCQYLLERLVDWLNCKDFAPTESYGLALPVLGAIIAHLYIAWIHPFGDGNGRTARLVEFLVLARSGVPKPAAQLLSNHYNETRSDYYRHLDRASKDRERGVASFIRYAVQGLVDGLRTQIAEVRAQQLEVAWQNYVHARFARATKAEKRQRDLILALSARPEPLTAGELSILTSNLAREYASSSEAGAARKLQRDLVALSERRLVVREGSKWRANLELMEAFLAARAPHAARPEEESG
ncbi:MAG: Fic family protein [Polyangiaceae bacterium]|nr:Fic family protein [Polyangiaceae bacterium]